MTGAAFDAIAGSYDDDFTRSLVGGAQRRAVWRSLDACLREAGERCDVLELNCGTGEDALHMARGGHRVIATDISNEMLRVAREKVEREGVGHDVQLRMLDCRALAAGEVAVSDLGGPFDLVFSNFGGLNCVSAETLQALAAALALCLKPGGQFIAVVMPRLCLWESVWALLRLDLKTAARRWRGGPVMARLGPHQPPLPVWYHSVAAMDHAVGCHFLLERVRPVGVTVPPSQLESLARRAPRWLALMERFDNRWLSGPWAAALSDHVLIQWRKR